ncbi:hypothetical protein [Myroides injenensis]|uniref:hypothetical protein n=1 Tax=Myroides injenensis TaxID=1183151 RepID=UPI000289C7DE|nr:hypothetical protein [Myroides injenensis]
MKKTYIGFAGLSLLLLLGTQTVQAQQGFGTDKPAKSAAVDIQSSKRGLLIPRVDLVETTNGITPINAPEKSLMVYNQATTTKDSATDVTPGYYYWDGGKWVRFAQQGDITAINLGGDVTGPTNATVINAIQGVPVDAKNPTANQVLTFVPGTGTEKGKWVPMSITPDVITGAKGITGTGITVTGGDKSTLTEVTLAITPGGANQVMVTSEDGKTTTWVNQNDIVTKNTTNVLKSEDNTLTSTVNNKVSNEVKLVKSIENTIVGNKLVTTVNGVSADGLDLTPAIQAGQKTSSVVNGSDKVTVVTTGAGTKDKNTEYTVDVVEANIKLEKLGGELPVYKLVKGNDGQVLITKDGISTWVDQSDIVPTTTNTLTKKTTGEGSEIKIDNNTIVSTVNGKEAEVKVIDNVTNTVNGTTIVTSVNGVDSGSVDLTPAIQAGQKTVEVINGTNTTVTKTPAAGDAKHTTYAVNVSNDAIQAAQKTTSVVGKDNKVSVITSGIGTTGNNTEYTVGVEQENLDLSLIGGTLKTTQIAQGKEGEVLTTIEEEGSTTVKWKKVSPQFFYMPAVIFDTKSKGTGLVRDLYKEYVDQFTGGKIGTGNDAYPIAHGAGGYTMPYTGGIVGSAGAPADIDVFARGELYYYVTYYDTKVFTNLSIDKDGKLTYDIIGTATPASYMNIVFVIK